MTDLHSATVSLLRALSESSSSSGEAVTAQDGVISVNGRRLIEPYVLASQRDSRSGTWPQIPAGHYFMLGDNRSNSCDSRDWGTVARANLIGPVFLTYWPPRRLGTP